MTKRSFLVVLFFAGAAAVAVAGGQGAQPTDCSLGSRRFEHPHLVGGPVCLPERAARIVALDPFTFEAMVAVGAPVVATRETYVDELLKHSPSFESQLEDVRRLGIEFDIEALVQSRPDVILCRRTACGNALRRFRQIAPVVAFDNTSSADWRESARFFAEAVGREAELMEVEQAYEARTQNVGDAVAPQRVTVSVLRVRSDQLRLYFEGSFSGIVVTDAGLHYPDGQAESADARRDDLGRPQLANISEEQLRLIEADYAFVFSTEIPEGGERANYLAELRDSSVWAQLEVVQRGDVHRVGTHWFAGGYIAADRMLDEISKIVLGREVRNGEE